MNPETVALVASLDALLRKQLDQFRRVLLVQSQLSVGMDGQHPMPKVLELLAEKNDILDLIRSGSKESQPLIEQWIAIKAGLPDSTEVLAIDELIGKLEELVKELRSQDEEMLRRFGGSDSAKGQVAPQSSEQHSRNLLHAYRALR